MPSANAKLQLRNTPENILNYLNRPGSEMMGEEQPKPPTKPVPSEYPDFMICS